MKVNLYNQLKLKWIEFVISRDKNFPVDKDLFIKVTKLAMEPVGTRKVPIYRTNHSKRAAFRLIKGGKDNY